MMTSYTTPIRRGGEVVGVAGVDVALSSLDRQARATKVLETGYAFVTSNTGGLVAFPPDGEARRHGRSLGEARERSTSAPELRSASQPRSRAGGAPARGRRARPGLRPRGDPVLRARRDRHVELRRGRPEERGARKREPPADDADRRRRWAALMLVGLAIALVAARIARPLRDIAEAATAIAAGDVEVEIGTHSDDEIGRVGDAFRGTSSSYMRELADAADRVARGDLTVEVAPRGGGDMLGNALQTMVARLNGLVGDLGGAASQLGSASQQMSSSSGETGRAVGEIARAVGGGAEGRGEQLRMVEAAKASTLETAAAADEARRVSEEGVAAARKAYDAMEAVRLSSTEVSGAIRRLASTCAGDRRHRHVDQRHRRPDEPAGAQRRDRGGPRGEQGRGFAVVADEVRKLAEEASSQPRRSRLIARHPGGRIGGRVLERDEPER